MGLLDLFRIWLAGASRGENEADEDDEDDGDFQPGNFIYVLLPGAIDPRERGTRYEDPIEALLARDGLGEVSGGGTQLGPDAPDGSMTIAACGIDIDTTARERVLPALRDLLGAVPAPDGTELQYTRDGKPMRDVFAAGRWTLDQARTTMHPGFGI